MICPQCKASEVRLVNYYRYLDAHCSKKHYECFVCGFQWTTEEKK